MNKLWARLSLAFGLVTLTAIIIAAMLANYQVSSEFRRFVMRGQMMDSWLPELAQYYADTGSWAGVESVLQDLRGPGMGAMGAGRGMRNGAPAFILTDASGKVVYDGTGGGAVQLSRQELVSAVPIEWQQQTVGYLLAGGRGPSELPPSAQLFLPKRLNN